MGRRRFSDPTFQLEETDDENDVRLSRLFATGVRELTYTHDLGAGWEHEVVLEKLVPMVPGPPLRCLTSVGDSPMEYPELYNEYGDEITDPVMTMPFNLDEVNATFVSGHYVVGPA